MTDDPPVHPDDVVPGEEERSSSGPSEEMGPGFYAALALVGLLVLLILLNPLALPTDAGRELAKTSWTLRSCADAGGTLVPVMNGSEITARFDPDKGRMTGSSGCNGYSAPYTTKGNTISFTGDVTMEKTCELPGIMEQESAFLSGIPKAASFGVSSQTLKMYDAAGETIFVFTAA
jgi:heat shock protein HslJ